MRSSLARKMSFRAAHLYEVESWTKQKNERFFGACHTPYGHGHSYQLELQISGPVDPVSGMIVNLVEVDQWLKQVIATVHDKHLNFEIDHFKQMVPTTENLADYLWHQLEPLVDSQSELFIEKLRLYESEDLWVEIESGRQTKSTDFDQKDKGV